MQIDLSIFNPKARPLIGVDISSSSVKMVELADGGKGGYRVERYAIEALPRDAVVDGNIVNLDGVEETIRRAWKRMGTSTRHVAMALPTAAVITKKIILPAHLREQEMELQVEAEANQYIPFALEEVNLDFQIVGPVASNPEDVEVMIAASRKEKVEDRVACAEGANLKPMVMDVESLATDAAYELILAQFARHGEDDVVAMVHVGANITRFSVSKGMQPLYSRESAFGSAQLTADIMRVYGMSADEAEAIKRSATPPENYTSEVLHNYLDNLGSEIARALQFFYTSTPYSQVDRVLLAGGGALIAGIDREIQTRTQIESVLANPFVGMTISPKVNERRLMADAPSLMVACGLALRRFDQ